MPVSALAIQLRSPSSRSTYQWLLGIDVQALLGREAEAGDYGMWHVGQTKSEGRGRKETRDHEAHLSGTLESKIRPKMKLLFLKVPDQTLN